MEIIGHQTRLAKVPLKKGSRGEFDQLLAYMKENISYVEDEMSQKGYWWDAVFYQEGDDCDYFWFSSKSEDWSSIKSDDQITPTPFREVYNKFKADCWLVEKLTEKDFFVSIWAPDLNLCL